MFHGSGPPTHNGGTRIRSLDSSQPSGGTAVLGSRLNQHPGEVAGHSFGSRTQPVGFNPHFPGTSVSGTFNPGSGASGVYKSANITLSESTCTRQDRPCEDRPRSILKNSSSITVHKSPGAEKYGAGEEERDSRRRRKPRQGKGVESQELKVRVSGGNWVGNPRFLAFERAAGTG